jgi:hypothetical protein
MIAVSSLLVKLRHLQPHLAGLGLQVALVVAGAGIASGRTAFVTLALHSRSASASRSAFNVSSTLPRNTRSRRFLIRSSSIVMTLFSGLGVVSVMAALLSAHLLRLATSKSAKFGAASPYLCAKDSVRHQNSMSSSFV